MRLSILLGACVAAAPSLAQSGWNNTSIRPGGSRAPSLQPSSAPILTPASSRPTTRTGSSPPSSTSAPPTTVTVSNGDTVDVAPGVVVFGGPGGGFFTVNGGAAIPIAAGATVTANQGSEDPAPTSEPPTSEPPTSEPPTSTQPTSSQPPTGTPKPYMIFPADGADTAAFLTTLQDLVKPEVPQVVDILDTGSNSNTTLMWVANLTDTQLKEVQGNSAIDGTMENANLTATAPAEEAEGQTVTPPKQKRRSLYDIARRAVINVDTDDFDLIQLSTAEGSQPGTTYDYDETAGTGISVYVIESDILMDHDEFTGGGRTTRKITVPDMTGGGLRGERAEFHGTCAASKAVGNTAGSAPKADFVAVDMTNDDVATLIAAFAMIGQDVAQKGLKGKAVISCSLTASEDSITEMGITRLRRVLGVLVSLDVPIILSAGNYGGDINTYPPMLADELPLITVGAVDDKGEIASWSQGGSLLTTAAGGVGIVCATNEAPDAYRIQQGTSFAAPLVAGMVAYWLGHPDYTEAFPASQVAQAAKDSVTSLHWARVEGGYNVAYNGAHECVDDSASESEGSTTPTRRRVMLEARQAAGNATLGLGGILAASCPLPPSSSSSSSVITVVPTTFSTVTSTASATSTAAAETSAPAIEPMYCYSFDPACYGWCCPDEPGGTCSSEFPGKQGCRCGAGGATNVVPTDAQCPMPA
ncbi:hypothetical protein J7T55_009757 [Diaporthe amygdali]|uniref:uncharacterized protein n=1 Tax=Phomopsis amygdali TaxID=1214568 RepID=UPI0022FEEB81|nr:uncharacterized protein J7T55_009757 [Diaporthe amygdali]KAJ0116607.1 hypothetical protein J7T55_009757 [Diaporthe amygdali]